MITKSPMLFVSPAKHGRHIGIMSPSASSSVSALSHFWFAIDNLKGCINFIQTFWKSQASVNIGQVG